MICPCKNCPRKGCGSFHDQCEGYQAYRAEADKKKEKRRITNEIESLNLGAHGKICLRKKHGKK